MTDKLPHQLLALFAPRPPLRWVPPVDHAPEERRTAPVSGLAQFLPALREYKDKDGFVPTESWLQRRDRKAAEHKAEVEKNLVEGPKNCLSFLDLAIPFFSLLVFIRSILDHSYANTRSQPERGPQHSWRRVQDADRGAAELRGQRAGSGARVLPLWAD